MVDNYLKTFLKCIYAVYRLHVFGDLCSVWTAYELYMNRKFDRNLCKNLEHKNKYRIFVAKWK